jgi:uncharacterized membrane protein
VDTHARTIAKSLSWRLVALLVTTAITWLVMHRLDLALTIGGLDATVKLVAYYVHERVWNRCGFGRRCAAPEYNI